MHPQWGVWWRTTVRTTRKAVLMLVSEHLVHLIVLWLVWRISPGTYYSPSVRILNLLARLWAGQDTRWCQWAVLAKAHLLYYACS